MDVLDVLLLAHLGISFHLMSSYAGFQDTANFVIAYEVVAAIPFVGFVIVFLVQTIRKFINSQAPQILFRRCTTLCCLSWVQKFNQLYTHTCHYK